MSELPIRGVLRELGQASLDNAARLRGDACVLLGAGSPSTAHALGVLSLEEAGKALMCASAEESAGGQPAPTREQFLREIRRHPDKLRKIRSGLNLLHTFANFLAEMQASGNPTLSSESDEEYYAKLKRQVDHDHAQRLRGIYVDLSNEDQVEVPNVITEAEAEEIIDVAGWAIRLAAEILSAEGVEPVWSRATHRLHESASASGQSS